MAFRAGIRKRDRGKQRSGVGMQRVRGEHLRLCKLYDHALMDHGDPVADKAHYGKIVCDKQIREAMLLLQLTHQVEHLRTDGNIQCSDGFVCDDELWIHDEGAHIDESRRGYRSI